MAYPQYDITFQSTAGTATVKPSATGAAGPVHSDGSHTFVLDVNGTQLTVDLTHESAADRTPKLVVTFK